MYVYPERAAPGNSSNPGFTYATYALSSGLTLIWTSLNGFPCASCARATTASVGGNLRSWVTDPVTFTVDDTVKFLGHSPPEHPPPTDTTFDPVRRSNENPPDPSVVTLELAPSELADTLTPATGVTPSAANTTPDHDTTAAALATCGDATAREPPTRAPATIVAMIDADFRQRVRAGRRCREIRAMSTAPKMAPLDQRRPRVSADRAHFAREPWAEGSRYPPWPGTTRYAS